MKCYSYYLNPLTEKEAVTIVMIGNVNKLRQMKVKASLHEESTEVRN
jgi:hypothetical protein